MDPPQSGSTQARADYTSPEDNISESLENFFNIPNGESAIFSSSHQQAAVDFLHHPEIDTPGVSGAFFNPAQAASGHEFMSANEPIGMGDFDFDSLVDWSGHEPSRLAMNDSGFDSFSELDQSVLPHGDQDWGLSQYSGATSDLHQATPYSLEVNAINVQNSLDSQSLTPVNVTQQSSIQEPTTLLWPSDSHSAAFLTTDNANATTSLDLTDESLVEYNTTNVHYPSFQSFADNASSSFQQLESQSYSSFPFTNLIDYPETWNSFPGNQMNMQVDNIVGRFDIQSQAQHNIDFAVNEPNHSPNTRYLGEPHIPSRLPILHTTTQTHQSAGGVEEVEPVANPVALQPNTQSFKKLPKARRGGRRGPLTKEQAQSQRVARLSGVCIRCRKTKIKCIGGIPCNACRASSKSRIWKTPCTKAQFLDIVESGSYFPLVVLQEVLSIQTLNMQSFCLQTYLMICLAEADKCASLTQIPWETKFVIPWSFGKEILSTILLDMLKEFGTKVLTDSNGPSTSRFISSLNSIVNKHPSGELVQCNADISRAMSVTWSHAIIKFCITCRYILVEKFSLDEIVFPLGQERIDQDCVEDATSTFTWIAARYLELCLFRYLQHLSNDLTERSTEEQKAYIICMFQVLLLNGGITNSASDPPGLDADHPYVQTVCQDFLDRQDRIRMALWVYSSIAISKLPPWSNIWETLQERWPLLSGRVMAERFHSSLAAFDTSANKKIEPLYESFDLFHEYSSILYELYDEFGATGFDYRPILSDEEIMRYRLVISNHLDNIRALAGQHTTVGALSFETEEQRKVLPILIFTFLANIKWEANLSKPRDIQDAIQTGELYFSHFVDGMVSRRYNISWADYITKFAKKTALSSEGAAEVLSAGFHKFCMAGNREIGNDYNSIICLHRVRTGQRWKKLKDLFGKEIILLGSPLPPFRRSPSMLIDIPRAVEAASDSQFSELMKIMSTDFYWLKDTCTKLSGVYEMIQKLEKAEGNEAKAIADQIQSRINTVFGGASFIHQVTLRETTLLDPFPLVLKTRQRLLEEANNAKDRQVILDFFIKKMAVTYWSGISMEDKEEIQELVNKSWIENPHVVSAAVNAWTIEAIGCLFDSFAAGTKSLEN